MFPLFALSIVIQFKKEGNNNDDDDDDSVSFFIHSSPSFFRAFARRSMIKSGTESHTNIIIEKHLFP